MSDQVSMAIDPSAKNPAQAAGSLITYLRRYSLSAFANVAQEDDDGNSLAGSVKAVEQKPVEQKDDLAEYQAVCAENNSSIIAIKAGIASGDLSLAAEARFELENEIKIALWRAPSKGGCFTTIERDVIKSTEFREANLGVEA